MRRRMLLLPLLLLPLAACNVLGLTGDDAVGSVAVADVKPGYADPDAAVAMVSAYRRSHGLSAVTINPKLTAIAASHAKRMAALNRVDHVLPGEGSFMKRMAAGGYDAGVAAENIGAGYDTLGEAMTGWKKSPHHNENLLRAGITEIGIAVAEAPGTRFRYFWSIVLAAPYQPPVGAPMGGPFMFTQ
jgi:uncharacterized protein YkwD